MTDTPQSLPITIRHRWEDRAVYTATAKAKSKADAFLEAVAAGATLNYSDLSDVVMPYGARLDGARLVGARLDGASLDGASLVGARLDGASLDGARLVGARLVGARLDGASLVGARLDGARLDGARLVGASLDGARLDGFTVAAGSLVAVAGPVGTGNRMVFGFMVRSEDAKKKPFLLLQCGCFTGDTKAYLARIKERYGAKEHSLYLAQCRAALACCKAIAATWRLAKVGK